MKHFLVVCDHEKFTVEATDVPDAIYQVRCKKCKVLDLKSEKWVFRDVRVYEESATIEAKSLPTVRSKRDDMEQLDWTGL